jgi:hypothetical protein
MMHATRLIVLTFLLVGLAVSPVSGHMARGSGAAVVPPDSLSHITWSTGRVQFLLHGFTREEMQDAYNQAFGLQGSLIGWPGTSSRIGLRGDLALCGADGEARILNDSWTVTKRNVGMMTIETSFTALYRLREPDNSRKIMPYTGIGLGGIFGFDQLWFSFNRSSEYHEGHSALTFRPAFEAHGLFGTVIPIKRRFSFVTEVLWIQAGKAPMKDIGSLSDEDKAERSLVYSVLQYPDMNITGWRVLVGMQYAK